MKSLRGGGGGGEEDAVAVGGWPVAAAIPCARDAAAVAPVGGGRLDARQEGATGRPRPVALSSSYLTRDAPARHLSSPLPAAEASALREARCSAADDAAPRPTEWCATGLQSKSRLREQSAMSRTWLKRTSAMLQSSLDIMSRVCQWPSNCQIPLH